MANRIAVETNKAKASDIKLMSKVSDKLGIDIEITDNEGIQARLGGDKQYSIEEAPNGFYDNGKIVINIEADKPLSAIFSHELIHELKDKNPEAYVQFRDFVIDTWKNNNAESLAEEINRKIEHYRDNGVDLTEEEAIEEILADSTWELVQSEDIINELCKQNRSLAEVIVDAIKNVIEKLKAVLTGNVSLYEPRIEKKLYEELGIAEEVAKMWADGIANMEKSIAYGDSDIAFSLRNKNININDKVPVVEHKAYINVPRYNKKKLNKLQDDVKKIKRGTYVNKATGYKADINVTTIKKLLNPTHKRFDVYSDRYINNLNAAVKLPELFENAIYVDTVNNQKSKNVGKQIIGFHHFVAPINMNNKGYRALITAREKVNSNILYIVRVELLNKKWNAPSTGIKSSRYVGVVPTASIPKLISGVKIYDYNLQGDVTYKTNDIKFSLKDNKGNELTDSQQEYFKNSKVRDEEGNLMVMYHGTPNGNFTVFKDGTYFTANEQYAERYQDPSSSSISYGKEKINPKTYAVYLNITKPFDIRNDSEARRIYIKYYIKGGNALGINPYKSDAFYDNIKEIDWTEGEDLRDFLIEEEYDYDGLVLGEGADGGYGAEVVYRGDSYVAFSPEQVKNIDNKNPTYDKDIRFAIKDNGNNLTAKQYFNFGWATANGVLNTKEAVDFFDKLKYVESKKYPKSKDGDYIIEVGEKDGINNKLVYTNGDWNDPRIYKVVTINALEDETTLTAIRKKVYYYEKVQGGIPQQAFDDIYGKRILSETYRSDWRSYEEFRAERERRSSEEYFGKNKGFNGRGRNTGSDKKYSLKKQDRTLKKLRNKLAEGEAKLKTDLSPEEKSIFKIYIKSAPKINK